MFRAKRTDNGEWVEGYYARSYNDDGNDNGNDNDNNHDYIVYSNDLCDSDCKKFCTYPIIGKTLCQYTGLNDKNGNKIFDGDFLDSDLYPFYSDGKHNYFAEIFVLDEQLTTCIETIRYPNSNVRGISDGLIDYVENFHSENWEIIGNVFDNPELLEEIRGDE